jgi:putative PIN family toxin of toxin-antitoxin system
MGVPVVVLDTNILVAALRSRRGASFRVLELLGGPDFDVAVSVPLVLEYEDVLARLVSDRLLQEQHAHAVIDYICSIAIRQSVFFLWRPFLRDPKDDMVLELAVAARCSRIVTHNIRDFAGSEEFGALPVTPGRFLHEIGRAS